MSKTSDSSGGWMSGSAPKSKRSIRMSIVTGAPSVAVVITVRTRRSIPWSSTKASALIGPRTSASSGASTVTR